MGDLYCAGKVFYADYQQFVFGGEHLGGYSAAVFFIADCRGCLVCDALQDYFGTVGRIRGGKMKNIFGGKSKKSNESEQAGGKK